MHEQDRQDSFIIIGSLYRPPLLLYTQEGEALLLFVETKRLPLSGRESPEELHAEQHLVFFWGEEAEPLFRKLEVAQRLFIQVSKLREKILLAHAVRILPPPEHRHDGVWRQVFKRLRQGRANRIPHA